MSDEDRYDGVVVNALVAAINILCPGVCVEMTGGTKGLVIHENTANIFEPWVLSFYDNKLYDLSLPSVKKEMEIVDVMKTMDNRIKLDHALLEEYGKN
jgi:hypothetical protein